MSKFGKYSTDEWPQSFRLTKTDSGTYKATVKSGPFRDKSWEAESETAALKLAKKEIDETVLKSNNSR
jgi:hypothetical protein